MKLIINADDLGFSKGINYGIYDAYKYGIVRSTTLMMNMKSTDHAIELLKDTNIGIGVHLNATAGKPLLNSEVLVDEDGVFRKTYEFTEDELKAMHLEFEAQIILAYEKGVKVTHLDSHHHIHMWQESIFTLVKALANKYNLKLRCDKQYTFMHEGLLEDVSTTEGFSQEFFDRTVYLEHLMDIIKRNKDKSTFEIMVHPGFLCGNLINRDSYREMRMVENSILTSQYMKDFILQEEIELVHFGQI
ncbi:MAG: ChbG/HpnK family deacetylase [Clostridia bacterium]|nr:ChbG/HpnK family deacetylase [Clostridia bacterium]